MKHTVMQNDANNNRRPQVSGLPPYNL